jgi:radical SAM superfamily enzyme YgiQ (UPF0313 family)
MINNPLRIYLCDLSHDSILLSSDTIPINIGFIGSYARKIHQNRIQVSLFKYPKHIIKAISELPPDLIALSNYSWNSRLAEYIAGIAKQANPATVTVQGGPNFPEQDELQLRFIQARPNTDFFIELEGEVAFASLVDCVLAARDGGQPLSEVTAPGCVSIVPSTRLDDQPVLRKGPRPNRVKDLDEIPSPYLNGMLDPFFDGQLVPFIETNRGCPFACTFCHTGNTYFNKINNFSIDRIKAEIHYIGKRIAKSGITHLYLADTNFGMYMRDREISVELAKAQEIYGWPFHIYATTGKNNKERVIEVTKELGQALTVHMSVQSMDPTVLKNIKRSNIRLDDYMQINRTLAARGQFTRGEIIAGLPGETRESCNRGVVALLDAEVDILTSYSLILLHGTPFQDPHYADQYKFVGKYRLVPLNFGEYAGVRVFDAEETGVANKDMSFDDYLWVRGLSLMIEVLHNSRPFDEFFKYARVHGLKPFAFIMMAYNEIKRAPAAVRAVLDGFLAETRGELWDSEVELVAHYSKDQNYQKLLNGEAGCNVINKYKAASLIVALDSWIDFLADLCIEVASASSAASADRRDSEVSREMGVLKEFVKNKITGLLDPRGDSTVRRMESSYDVKAWMQDSGLAPLAQFELSVPIEYEFFYAPEQLAVSKDMLRRYGSDLNGLSKIVTRVSSIESLFRHCRVSISTLEAASV